MWCGKVVGHGGSVWRWGVTGSQLPIFVPLTLVPRFPIYLGSRLAIDTSYGRIFPYSIVFVKEMINNEICLLSVTNILIRKQSNCMYCRITSQ